MSSEPDSPGTHEGGRLRPLALVGVLALTPLLFFGGPDWIAAYLSTSVWNLGHIALFALITLALHPWRWLRGVRLWLAATVAALVVGLAIEAVQSQLGREADGQDLLRNLIGVWLVLAWRPLLASHKIGRVKPPMLILAAISALLLVFELGKTGVATAQQLELDRLLPRLYDFSHTDPSPFWQGRLASSPDHGAADSPSLRIELGTERFSGVSLNRLPADWRRFDTLSVSLFNPGSEPLPLTLRINDLKHERGDNAYADRYNTSLLLQPGPNRFELPLSEVAGAPRQRAMDMGRIHRVMLFAVNLPEPRVVYLQDLRLRAMTRD